MLMQDSFKKILRFKGIDEGYNIQFDNFPAKENLNFMLIGL